MTIAVKRQMFSVKGRDVFQLTLEHNIEAKHYYITSSLPNWLLEQHPKPELELKEQHPHFDMNQVTLKLAELANQLLQNSYTKHFYYPPLILNEKGKFKSDASQNFRQAIHNIQIEKLPYVSVLSRPFESLYFTCALLNIQFNNACYDFANKIKKKDFEMNLQNESQRNDYIDLYYSIKSFVIVETNNTYGSVPSFQAGLNSRGEVVIAFVNHSLALQEQFL